MPLDKFNSSQNGLLSICSNISLCSLIASLTDAFFELYSVKDFSIADIWKELVGKNKLYGYESLVNFYHLTNLEIYNELLKNK